MAISTPNSRNSAFLHEAQELRLPKIRHIPDQASRKGHQKGALDSSNNISSSSAINKSIMLQAKH